MPDRSTPQTKARATANQRLQCAISRCPKRRVFTSQYCATHRLHCAHYGHPLGRYVKPWEYHWHLVSVRRLFRAHKGHPAYLAALDFMATVLEPGSEPRRTGHTASGLSAEWLLWRELRRLADNKKKTPRLHAKDGAHVHPQDALEVVASLWLLSNDSPRTLDDGPRLTYQLGHAMFRLAPLRSVRYYEHSTRRMVTLDTKAPAGIAARLLGERIRTKLGRFLYNLTNAIGVPR